MSCVVRGQGEGVWETSVLRGSGGRAVAEVGGTRQEGGGRRG